MTGTARSSGLQTKHDACEGSYDVIRFIDGCRLLE